LPESIFSIVMLPNGHCGHEHGSPFQNLTVFLP